MSVTPQAAVAASAPATPPPTDAARPGRQYSLDVLRMLAICGVVAIHTVGAVVAHDELRGTLQWWLAAGVDIGATWTVPLFVMISGALTLSPRAHADGPGAFYRRRFTRILPALVVWHVIYLVVARVGLRGERLTIEGLAVLLIDARVFTALYFLWLIAGLYVIAPVLVAFLRDGGQRRALILSAVALGFTLVAFVVSAVATRLGVSRPIHLGALTMWWPYVGYFVAGWALRTVRLGPRATALASVAALVLLIEAVWQWGTRAERPLLQILMPIGYLGASVALATICIFLVGVSLGARHTPSPGAARWVVRLSEASFGVFLVHLLVFELLRYVLPAVRSAESLPVMLGTFVVVLVTSFAISLGAARIPYVRAVF
ncbi:acyltransferase [Micromonospora inositola]|uniref:Surface polysaccharide O-acyltransferase, integral membrane enzyme n=1 Tax=Micromonospora inositola TaxID=47865 RepID=A0A1C5K1H4_9ACTN|nr:acyltransferase family protein [Micromonospora inositola]SCG76598.1 Surface polysaccharide O-acyltransferase, integral membrane enzyme [Micromonospora inositola]